MNQDIPHLTLTRTGAQDGAMMGFLNGPCLPTIFTLEDALPTNKGGASCIPAGTYLCKPHGWKGEVVRFTRVWEITGVMGHSAVLIHWGNTIKDTKLCVLVGLGKTASTVTQSKAAVNVMRQVLGEKQFWLTIKDAHHAVV